MYGYRMKFNGLKYIKTFFYMKQNVEIQDIYNNL
jgi:hypothetical protein